MSKVIKSPAAEEDLTEIWLFIASENSTAADGFVEKLNKTAELIASQPLLAVSWSALGEGVRSHAFGNYVLFYRPVSSGIELVRVLHGARDIPDLFGRTP